MYNGAGLVASGVGRVSGMCVAGRLLGRVLTAEAFRYSDVGVCRIWGKAVGLDEL